MAQHVVHQAALAAKQIRAASVNFMKPAVGRYRHAAHGISCHYMLLSGDGQSYAV